MSRSIAFFTAMILGAVPAADSAANEFAAGHVELAQASPGAIATEQTRQIQLGLKREGYDPGPVDGLMGRRTANAIREFQADHGLAVTGMASRTVYEMLVPQADRGEGTEAPPPADAQPGQAGADDARERLASRIEDMAEDFCRSVHDTSGSVHSEAIKTSPGDESEPPDVIVDYRGIECAGVDNAPLLQGGFCGLTTEGMKCKVDVFSYEDGDYVEARSYLD